MSKITNNNFAEPLLSKAKLEELQEEYSIILREIIEYITKTSASRLNGRLFQRSAINFGRSIPQGLVFQRKKRSKWVIRRRTTGL